MTSEPRRHHLVPDFYLRRFSDERGRVHATELPGERSFTTATKNVAVETGYYDLDGVPQEERADVERLLSRLEGHAAEAWASFDPNSSWPPDPDRVGAIAAWLTLQYTRGRSGLWRWNEMGRTILRLQVIAGGRRGLRRSLPHATDERIEELLSQAHADALTFTPPRNEYLRMMLTMARDHAAEFAHYTWTLMHFERRRLATCDNPVLLIENEPDPNQGVGLFSADIVAVPVRRDCALLLQRGRRTHDRRIPGTTYFARLLNTLTANNAERFVIHHPDDAPMGGIVLPEPRSQEDYAPMVEELSRFAPRDEPPPA